MKCPNCGTEFEGNFCPACGSKADTFSSNSKPQQEEVAPDSKTQQEEVTEGAFSQTNDIAPSNIEPTPKKRLPKPALIGVLAIAVIIALIIVFGSSVGSNSSGDHSSLSLKLCSHEWKYGYCQKCGILSDVATEDLNDHLTSWYGVYLLLNYSFSGDEKIGDNITISIDTIEKEDSTYTVDGNATLKYQGKDCVSTFHYVGEWDEEGESVHFKKTDLTFSEPTNLIKSDWEIGYYVDEFGESTKNSYIIGTFSGTFSNSATTNSKLKVFVYLDGTTTTIRLLEYESHKATFLSSETITLKIKTDTGSTFSYTLYYSGGDLYSFDSSLAAKIKSNKNLSCYISTYSKYQTVPDTYNFKINNIGLDTLLK